MMKFYSLIPDCQEPAPPETDYRSAREIGVVRLGEQAFYFRKARKVYYIRYHRIRSCFRRVMVVPARLCCGQGGLPVENLVICGDEGELAQIQIPGERAGKALLEEMKERAPDVEIGYWKKEKEVQ
ncbi:MAG: hypothetical protein LUG99_18450 [Lachnospiraceae bacterium]|nr:hypothetical protein [Lachnospiraceae bacterium]